MITRTTFAVRAATSLGILLMTSLPAVAQDVFQCNPDTRSTSSWHELTLLGGEYWLNRSDITSEEAANDPALSLLPLRSIKIPASMDGRPTFIANWRHVKVDWGGNEEGQDLADPIRSQHGASWCVSTPGNGVTLRAAVRLDQRWEGGWSLDWDGEDYDHIDGRIQARTHLIEGTGFPVAEWVVRDSAVAEARAELFYGNLERKWGGFMGYEFLLGLVIERERYVKDGRTRYRYRRSLQGVVGKRTYLDPRVGTGAPFMREEANVTFRGSTVEANARSQSRMGGGVRWGPTYQEVVTLVCGTPEGCSMPVTTPAAEMEYVAGVDDEARARQMCAAAARSNPNVDPADCDATLVQQKFDELVDVTQAEIDAFLDERTDVVGRSQISERIVASGQRGEGLTAISELQRVCRRLIRQEQEAGPAVAPAGGDWLSQGGPPKVPAECDQYREPGEEPPQPDAAETEAARAAAEADVRERCATWARDSARADSGAWSFGELYRSCLAANQGASGGG